MDILIEKVVLHVLDPAAGAPVLSAEPMDLHSEIEEYLEAHFLKCLESDAAQECNINEVTEFHQRMEVLKANPLEEFMDCSSWLAEKFYNVISGNSEIPSGDLICMLCRDKGGRQYFAVMKMNFHDGYSHYYMNGTLSIVGQRVLLPGTGRKLEEAFIVNMETGDVRLIEKKYLMMDETKEAYISTRILGCTAEISEKDKLMAVKKAVQKANKEVLGNQKTVEQELMSRMHTCLTAEVSPTVEDICHEVLRDYPQIEETVAQHLAMDQIDMEATVQVSEATVKRFEKQSVKASGGIEVKIPADLYRDPNAVEFINNPDGTISLLVKNILI